MRLVCSNCEAPYVTTLVNAERFPLGLCRACRKHEERVQARELPVVRVFGMELDMARWFGGETPHYDERGRR